MQHRDRVGVGAGGDLGPAGRQEFTVVDLGDAVEAGVAAGGDHDRVGAVAGAMLAEDVRLHGGVLDFGVVDGICRRGQRGAGGRPEDGVARGSAQRLLPVADGTSVTTVGVAGHQLRTNSDRRSGPGHHGRGRPASSTTRPPLGLALDGGVGGVGGVGGDRREPVKPMSPKSLHTTTMSPGPWGSSARSPAADTVLESSVWIRRTVPMSVCQSVAGPCAVSCVPAQRPGPGFAESVRSRTAPQDRTSPSAARTSKQPRGSSNPSSWPSPSSQSEAASNADAADTSRGQVR